MRSVLPRPSRGIAVKQLLSAEEIREGVVRLADKIAADGAGRPLTVVGVLTGSLVVLADLIRQLEMPLRVGLIEARSYRGAAIEPGELALNDRLLPALQDRHVLLLDDIFDTGHTLAAITRHVAAQAPASLRSAVLLRKADRQEADIDPDYVAFDIPDLFVVGYGLDYNDQHRHLPYLAALDEDDLAPTRGEQREDNE